MILHSCTFENHAPQLRRESNFQKKSRNNWRKGCVKHEMHKENNKLHTKFIKWQVLCIPSFLQKGLGGENSTGVELQAVFEGARSEHIAKRTSNRATRASNNDKIRSFWSRLGVKKWYFWSKVFEVVFQNCACHPIEKHIFQNMWCEKWVRS